ncbi:uncharacterized protein TNCT_633491 [Trichonephila clavata]|uniref:Uncharacterized protein n=1 Tax=Trichonephila clavata TaxID=2740835 RepID=A0A8X6JB75_TRICU|nr:uncharacterized protein TNCT_633491 [Trichonephila clavata]
MEGGGGTAAMESGFINSQPSMAEFMTALPHINETFHRGSSITGGSAALCPPPQQQSAAGAAAAAPESGSDAGKHPNGYSAVAVPEYPWMKEKKTTRKQQQGKARSPMSNS